MITIYHLNHSCKDCMPGQVLKLLPINIAAGSEHAEAYEGWRQAFADGLSVFGLRHMTPEQPFGEVPVSKLEIEQECELVRRQYFPHIRSRYQAFFGLATLEEAIAFRQAAKAGTGIMGAIWEVEADRICHRGDMRLLMPEHCTDANLLAYWEGKPLDTGAPIWECMAVPPVTMVRCVVPGERAAAAGAEPAASRAAYHEAGHAALWLAFGLPIDRIVIKSEIGSFLRAHPWRSGLGPVLVLVASGSAAEARCIPELVTTLNALGTWGPSAGNDYAFAIGELTREFPDVDRDTLKGILFDAWKIAFDFLGMPDVWSAVSELANRLDREGFVSGHDAGLTWGQCPGIGASVAALKASLAKLNR